MSQPVEIPKSSRRFACIARDASAACPSERVLAEETAVALVYGGSTEAVMMATPADLEDFGVGFSFTEGVIEHPDQVADFAVIHRAAGIELRMWLSRQRETVYRNRRRRLAGPTGCGLCGIESLAEALRPIRPVGRDVSFDPGQIADAVAEMVSGQELNRQTRATHAAGFYQPGRGIVAIREDVGRHNALDKLAGALLRRSVDTTRGALVITSRVSLEMVQKAAAIGAPVLIAVSAPTALAVRTAELAGITLVAVARGESSQVFAHPERLAPT